jgi:Cysteine-rich secretory protein family
LRSIVTTAALASVVAIGLLLHQPGAVASASVATECRDSKRAFTEISRPRFDRAGACVVNAYRKKHHRPALRVSARLSEAARRYARFCSERCNYFPGYSGPHAVCSTKDTRKFVEAAHYHLGSAADLGCLTRYQFGGEWNAQDMSKPQGHCGDFCSVEPNWIYFSTHGQMAKDLGVGTIKRKAKIQTVLLFVKP